MPGDPPALGKLVDIGGRRIHVFCTGSGSPAIVISGSYSFHWVLVQPRLSMFTRVCTYDGAGTAWSDEGRWATCADRVDELHRLVAAAKIERPFILAGFSVGALVARRYAAVYPKDLSGMVLIDHAFLPEPNKTAPAINGTDTAPVLIEQTPILTTTRESSNFANLPEWARKLEDWAEKRQPRPDASLAAASCEADLNAASQQIRSLTDLPLFVVSASNSAPGYSELQSRLLALSSKSTHLQSDKSFHSIEIDDPDTVVAALRMDLDKARQN